VNVKSGTP